MVLKEQLAERRTALPVLHVKGSHYDVGYDIGRFFKSIIQDMLDTYQPLINDYLPAYATPEGKEVYNDTLECVRERFPRYIRELEGMAHGAEVPFYKLFLIHIDDILPCAAHGILSHNTNGCSTLCVNEPGAELLGHTEDAFSGALNHCFIVVAEIPESREKFCSFCYAGYLPGYAMNFNQHGLVFTLNIVAAKHMVKARTPRTFLCRRLLACESLSEVETVLRDKGCGAGDGMSVNLTFLNQEGDRLFHNVEVAPALPPSMESPLSILTISPSEQMFHCNKYLRLNIAEAGGPIFASSDARMNAYKSRARPCSRRDLIELLGDRSDPTFTIFRDGPHEVVKTVAVGVFDLIARTWSLYLGNPKYVEPLVVLPLDLN